MQDVVGPKLQDLKQALKSLPWTDVSNMAIRLEVPYKVIQDIEEQYHDPSRRLLAVMDEWLTSDSQASWKKIVKALRAIEKKVLANEIEQSRVLTGDEHPFPISQTVQLHYSQPTLVQDVVKPKLKDLTQALKCLPWSDVYNMAIQLEVPYKVIQNIEEQYHDPSRRLPAVMHEWLTSDPKASWKKIVKALKDIGKSVLAKEIEQSRVLTGDEH